MERYKILKDIGSGKFGVAKLVSDKGTKELFAVKYIEKGQKVDENVNREIMTHRSLKHPNIIRFKEVLLTPTHLVIAMEYAADGELFERIYIAGRFSEDELADLTGELMRLAMGRISDSELEYAEKICRFVHDINRELTLVVPVMDDNSEMKKKMETMLQSVVKIENAIFCVHVRGSKYIPLLRTSDSGYSFLGVSDIEL